MNDLSQLRATLKSLADSASDEKLVEAVLAVVSQYDLGKPQEVTVNTMSLTRRNNAEQQANRILGIGR